MQPVEIEQCADNHSLLRFLDEDGLMRTLGIQNVIARQRIDLNPTFILRSLQHYRTLEGHRGDCHENEIVMLHPEKGIPLSNMNLNPVLVSCWSLCKNSDLLTDIPWRTFPGSVAVIESTVADIKKIIDWLAPTPHEAVAHSCNGGSLRADFTHHGKIIYYSIHDYNIIHNQSILSYNCFFKRYDPYSMENEYRFMVMFANHLHFRPNVYSVQLDQTDYIKKIYLTGEAFTEDQLSRINPYYSHLVEII